MNNIWDIEKWAGEQTEEWAWWDNYLIVWESNWDMCETMSDEKDKERDKLSNSSIYESLECKIRIEILCWN